MVVRARSVSGTNRGASSGLPLTVQFVQRLRTLSEAECYARCYGGRSEESVRVVKVTAAPADRHTFSGELLRELFEERIDSREQPEAA